MSNNRKPTVLIVEDSKDLADLYQTWLADTCDTRVALTGAEAVEFFGPDVDVVLLDRRMPDQSGDDVLGQLRATGISCQIAMVTAVEPDADLAKLDVDAYLTKPLNADELQRLITELDERNALESALDQYLQLVAKKRTYEAEYDSGELQNLPEYLQVTSELKGRRSQLNSLIEQLDDPELLTREVIHTEPSPPPLYQTRQIEFFLLWFSAALTYGIGDIVSTLYAVRRVPDLMEANPVVDGILSQFGIPGFLGLKLFVFLILLTISVQGARSHDRFSYYWPPLLAILLGSALTIWNVVLILTGV